MLNTVVQATYLDELGYNVRRVAMNNDESGALGFEASIQVVQGF